MLTAGSLRIETFEGSRPRLRRMREGYGCSIDRDTSGVARGVKISSESLSGNCIGPRVRGTTRLFDGDPQAVF